MLPSTCIYRRTTVRQSRTDGLCVACGEWLDPDRPRPPPPLPPPPPPPPSPFLLTSAGGPRKWMEMVAALHRAGYGRLRLSAFWANAGPAPVWFGDIAPVTWFEPDHGAILARYPVRTVSPGLADEMPNELPMISSRRCWSRGDQHPWPEYESATPEQAAVQWLEQYPELAREGRGNDPAYVDWYTRMLEATAPHGLVTAYSYWGPFP